MKCKQIKIGIYFERIWRDLLNCDQKNVYYGHKNILAYLGKNRQDNFCPINKI
jgi:hypothetical protein